MTRALYRPQHPARSQRPRGRMELYTVRARREEDWSYTESARGGTRTTGLRRGRAARDDGAGKARRAPRGGAGHRAPLRPRAALPERDPAEHLALDGRRRPGGLRLRAPAPRARGGPGDGLRGLERGLRLPGEPRLPRRPPRDDHLLRAGTRCLLLVQAQAQGGEGGMSRARASSGCTSRPSQSTTRSSGTSCSTGGPRGCGACSSSASP